MDERRRVGNLRFEPDQGVLVVGARTAVLDRDPAPGQVIGQYVELVVGQREVKPASHVDLRERELVVLSDLLELSPVELDTLIDRELDRLLGSAAPAAIVARERSKLRMALAAVAGLVVVGGVGLGGLALANGSSSSIHGVPTAVVQTIQLPDGTTATRVESPTVSPAADGANIGSAVSYERNP